MPILAELMIENQGFDAAPRQWYFFIPECICQKPIDTVVATIGLSLYRKLCFTLGEGFEHDFQ